MSAPSSSYLMHRIAAWMLVLAWFAGVSFLSSLTPKDLPDLPKFEIPHFDKVVHFTMFAAGGLLLAHAFRVSTRWSARGIILVASILGLALGIFDEFHQSFRPGRSGNDVGDIIADFLGAIFGAILYFKLSHVFSRHYPAADRAASQ